MTEISNIVLKANVSDIQNASNELDKFADKAQKAGKGADDLNSSFRAGASVREKVVKELSGGAKAASDQAKELQNLLNKISPATNALNKLQEIQEKLSSFQQKGMVNDDQFTVYSQAIETTREKLGRLVDAETEDGRAKLQLEYATKRVALAQDAFLSKLGEQSALFRASKADAAEYRAAQLGISEQAAPLIASLREQERAIAREADQKRAAAISSRGLREAIAQQEAAERAEAAELKRSETMRQSFINSLQDQANAINKTRSEILEMKAAQLGVTTQAAPFIARLREQESAFRQGSITAGQYRQAMRQLPMQITDVVTSLASGMPIYLVAIQQGGQIKDSFGGIGNAAKALVSAINPLTAIFGLSAVAVGGFALAAYQGADELEELNKSLILTGNYAGVTGGQLQGMAAKIASATNTTQHSAVAALATLNSTGKYTAQQLESVGTAIQNMSRTGAISTEELVKQFQSLGEDPVSAIVKLNDQYNFLTTSTYQQIKSLQEQGDTLAATDLAMNTYADTVNQRSGQITQNLGYLETGWNAIKSAAAGAWDAMLNIGRGDTLESLLSQAQERARKNLPGAYTGGGLGATGAAAQQYGANNNADVNILQNVVSLNSDITKAISEQARIRKESITDLNTLNGYEQKAKTNAEKRASEYVRINKLLKEGVITEQQAAQYRSAVDSSLKDPKASKSTLYTIL
ncbi:phage tail length tape measure family protein, partial [Erwinia typographi]|uniref:phage tail length tape measure family protein n=1 Tax=Erwinia typographi TaxID=371042 RepID=UPI0018DD56DE